MTNPLSDPSYLLPPLLVSGVSLSLIAVVYHFAYRNLTTGIFCGLLFSVGVVSFFIFGMRSSPDAHQALVWDRWLAAIGFISYVLYYHFTLAYTGMRGQRHVLLAGYLLLLLFVSLSQTDLLIQAMRTESYGYAPTFGLLFVPLSAIGLLFMGWGAYNLLRRYHTSHSPDERNRIIYLFIAVAFPILGAFLDTFTNLPPAAIWGNLIFCIICSVAILKYHLLDIHIVVRKGLAYLLMSIMVAIPYVGIISLLYYAFGRKLESWWVQAVIILLLAIILRPLYSLAQNSVDRIFYRDRYEYLQALQRFTQEAQSIVDPNKLGTSLVKLICDALRSSMTCLLLPSSNNNGFVLAACAGLENPPSDVIIRSESLLVKQLKRQDRIISSREFDITPELQSLAYKERRNLEQLNGELYIPIRTRSQELVGVLILGQKLGQQDYGNEDRRVLTALARHMAMTLENARLYSEALKARQNLEAWLNSMSDCVIIVNTDHTIQFRNKAAMEKFNFRPGSICWEALGNKEQCSYCSMQSYTNNSTQGFQFIADIQDRQYDIAMAPLLDPNGQLTVIEVLRDITERKHAEEELKESERRYRLLAENAKDVIWTVDMNMRPTFMSPSITRLLGYSVEEAMAKPMEAVYTPDSFDTAMKVLAEELAKENMEQQDLSRSRTMELELYRKDGSIVPIEGKFTFIRDPDGQPVEILAIARDITERKQADGELLAYQKELRSLASELSLAEERERRRIATELHDRISQNLAICRMKLGALVKASISTSFTKPLGEIQTLMKYLIEEVRSLTFEISSPLLYELGLEAAVEHLTEQIQKEHGITFNFEDDRQPKLLDNDIRVLLFQAVRELLINITKHAKARHARVCMERHNGNLRITVVDDGVGFDISKISPDSKRIKGFGLFNIRERLHQIGGYIEVESEHGRGTRVTLAAPLKQE